MEPPLREGEELRSSVAPEDDRHLLTDHAACIAEWLRSTVTRAAFAFSV
ncbi:hypothetical protein P6B95_02440 [Streptomyces atratus]|nr:hypothetical protein [Streptomyces atratus]WPW26425.1 hypothetical protein P6B95_02440 [Streptomyces atratus]